MGKASQEAAAEAYAKYVKERNAAVKANPEAPEEGPKKKAAKK